MTIRSATRPVRAFQKKPKKPDRRILAPHLKHIHNPRPRPPIRKLDRNAHFAHALDPIAEHQRRDEPLLVVLDHQLPIVGRHQMVELQPRVAEGLPLRVVLLQEELAPHLRGDDGRLVAQLPPALLRTRRRAEVIPRAGA